MKAVDEWMEGANTFMICPHECIFNPRFAKYVSKVCKILKNEEVPFVGYNRENSSKI